MLINKNKSLTEHGKNKAKAKAILNYYKQQVAMTFNPIIRNMRRKIPLAMITPHETLATEMYGILSGIKRGADGYPALSALGHTYDWKTSSVARGRAASTFILHMLGNYLAHGNLYHVLPIDENRPLSAKAIIGQFALMTFPRFPEFDVTKLKTAEVISALFGTAARDNNAAGAAAENMDRAHRHGMYLMGKTQGEFRRNEIFNVTKDNIFTNSKKYRASINLVAADKDFAKVLVGMLKSLKQAGSPKKALRLFEESLIGGNSSFPTGEVDPNTNQFYWAVPYIGIYDVEYAEMKEEV